MNIIPNPNKVLVKISKEDIEALTDKWIERSDGTKVKFAIRENYSEGYDKRFEQAVSVGRIVAIGENVTDILPSDLGILDYLVTNDSDVLIGFVGGNQMVSIEPKTTYHKDSALPSHNGRRGWIKGDFDMISPLLGIVRNDKLIPLSPYIFLVSKSSKIMTVLVNGQIVQNTETISEREVLAAPKDSYYKDGDAILIQEKDMFSRTVQGREISVVFDRDILGKKNKV